MARRLRRRLSYATVLSSLTAFVVLCGGAAYAANQLGRGSVGKKQLKANAVTTAKIKKEAVTPLKIRGGTIDGSKVKDGSLGADRLDLGSQPFQRIVHEARTSSTVQVPSDFTPFPLVNPTYTQAAGEDDTFVGSVEVTFSAACEPPRSASAEITLDAVKPAEPETGESIATGEVENDDPGTVTKQFTVTGQGIGGRFRPDAPTPHTLGLLVDSNCKSGSGVTATFGAVDVIGVK